MVGIIGAAYADEYMDDKYAQVARLNGRRHGQYSNGSLM